MKRSIAKSVSVTKNFSVTITVEDILRKFRLHGLGVQVDVVDLAPTGEVRLCTLGEDRVLRAEWQTTTEGK